VVINNTQQSLPQTVGRDCKRQRPCNASLSAENKSHAGRGCRLVQSPSPASRRPTPTKEIAEKLMLFFPGLAMHVFRSDDAAVWYGSCPYCNPARPLVKR